MTQLEEETRPLARWRKSFGTIFGPLGRQVLVHRPAQRHVHELHPPANTQCRQAEQPGQQRQVALPHIAPEIGGLRLRMGRLSIQAGGDIASSAQDESIEVAHHRPEHVKEQREGVLIAEDLQGVVALQQGERRDEAGEASRLQDGMRGGRIAAVDRPPTIAQGATDSQDADARPMASGLITRPSCSPIHCSSNSLTDVSASACTPVRIRQDHFSLLLNSKILAAPSPHTEARGPASLLAVSSRRDKTCFTTG